ncbi:MAG TPA: vWA domain-containing protein, partial [Polyangiaceae bacterium]|nr:vWA domain-containing protein [Polyangiaceae bacterium]
MSKRVAAFRSRAPWWGGRVAAVLSASVALNCGASDEGSSLFDPMDPVVTGGDTTFGTPTLTSSGGAATLSTATHSASGGVSSLASSTTTDSSGGTLGQSGAGAGGSSTTEGGTGISGGDGGSAGVGGSSTDAAGGSSAGTGGSSAGTGGSNTDGAGGSTSGAGGSTSGAGGSSTGAVGGSTGEAGESGTETGGDSGASGGDGSSTEGAGGSNTGGTGGTGETGETGGTGSGVGGATEGAGGTESLGGGGGAPGGAGGAAGASGCGLSFEQRPNTVYFALDRSSSMIDDGFWDPVKEGVLDTVAAFEQRMRFGFAAFTGQSGLTCPLDLTAAASIRLDNLAEINAVLDPLEPPDPEGVKGETPTAAAMAAVRETLALDAAPGEVFVFLITDGDPDFCDDAGAACPSDALVYELQAASLDGVETRVFNIAGGAATAARLEAFA